MPVELLVAATDALGITAPVLSETVPVMAPLPESCAIAAKGVTIAIAISATHFQLMNPEHPAAFPRRDFPHSVCIFASSQRFTGNRGMVPACRTPAGLHARVV